MLPIAERLDSIDGWDRVGEGKERVKGAGWMFINIFRTENQGGSSAIHLLFQSHIG